MSQNQQGSGDHIWHDEAHHFERPHQRHVHHQVNALFSEQHAQAQRDNTNTPAQNHLNVDNAFSKADTLGLSDMFPSSQQVDHLATNKSAIMSRTTEDKQALAGIPGDFKHKVFDSNFAGGGLQQFINGSDAQGNHSLPSNGEAEYYDPNNTKVHMAKDQNGRNVAVAEEFVTPNLHSGEITTKQEFGGDGLYVARMKLSASGGTWPAFWGSSKGWTSEIDTIEALHNGEQGGGGSNPDNHNYHYGGTWNEGKGGAGAWKNVQDILNQEGKGETLTNSFHNYAVRVQGSHLSCYFDGHNIGSINQPNAQTKMNWMVNTAVGGNWEGNAHNHDGPYGQGHGTEIQYVKIFK